MGKWVVDPACEAIRKGYVCVLCAIKIAVPFYEDDCGAFYTLCTACASKEFGPGMLVPTVGRVEAPCRQCARYNDVGVAKCYWCEASAPTNGMAPRPVLGAGQFICDPLKANHLIQMGEYMWIYVPGVVDEP